MNKIKYILLIFTVIIATFGCEEIEVGNDFLKKPASADITIDTVYSNLKNATYALNAAYTTLPYRIPYGWSAISNMMNMDVPESLTDLGQSYLSWGGVNRFYYAGSMDAGLMNTIGHSRFHFSREDSWLGIRRALTFIENIDGVPDATQEEKENMKAEAYMVIATHYTELFRTYGGLPWLDAAYIPGQSQSSWPRMTAEATMDSICSLCDRAAAILPWYLEDTNEAGRFTKAAAMGLKVRVLLFGASPLFNSDAPYKDGQASQEHLTWFGGYNATHWKNVVTAAQEFITELESSGFYSLVNTGNPRADFRTAYNDRSSSELLIQTHRYYKHNKWFIEACYGETMAGYGGIARPTQELVDMYTMTDGSDFDWNNPMHAAAPYDNRDPRLYETAIVNGDAFRGRTAELWTGGRDRNTLARAAAGTGYMLRKFCLDGDAAALNTVSNWPYLRLPEIYLSLAEALNEVNGGPTAEAYEYLGKTKDRVGVNRVIQNLSQDEFREEVLTERAREFYMEEVRLYDLVRWKKTFIQPHGIEITKAGDGSLSYNIVGTNSFKRVWVDNWDAKWYLEALPSDEVNKDYGIIQNPGW